jgi:signal transduction histidine kinase
MSARREAKRRKSHRQWRNVANGACDFAFVLDAAMDVINVVAFRNRTPPAVTGLRLQDIVTQTSYDPIYKLIAESIESEHACTFEFLLFKSSDKTVSYNARIEPGGDTAGIACTMYLTSNDAERIAAEEFAELRDNLAQASRLSLSGNLASEYAHQLAQPLQVIGLQGFTLKNRLRMGEATAEQMLLNVKEILEQVEHAREVIFGMRDFLHDRRSRLAATELEVIISQALKLVQPRPDISTAKISVLDHEQLLEQDPPLEVHVDRVQTTYVLINLMVNAIEACREANVQEPEVIIQVKSDPDSVKHMLVSVSDNGPGLPKGKTETVFRRFFTAKKSGFGFGLAICRDVVERQRGTIEASNNAANGCAFIFSLLFQSDEAEEKTVQLEEAAGKMMEQDDN